MPIGELSRRVGVPRDTLRVWERRYGVLKPRRTAGNARLYSAVDEARVRLMQRYINQHMPPAQAAQLSLSARFSLKPGARSSNSAMDLVHAGEELCRALDNFDETAADQALEQMIRQGSATTVLRHVVLPYLHDVGERWAEGHTTVAQEHFASNFVMFRLAAMSRGWDRGLGPRALLACTPEEQHTIGLMCFGIALHQHGWRIVWLGAATPIEMLEATADRVQPDLITVCAYSAERIAPDLGRLREVGQRWPLALAGGAARDEFAAGCHARHLDEDPIAAAATVAMGY